MHQIVEGTLSGGVNQEGIDHYSNLIDELLKNGEKLWIFEVSYFLHLHLCAPLTLFSFLNVGIKPFVSLLHLDLPQGLEDKYKSFLSRSFMYELFHSLSLYRYRYTYIIEHYTILMCIWMSLFSLIFYYYYYVKIQPYLERLILILKNCNKLSKQNLKTYDATNGR